MNYGLIAAVTMAMAGTFVPDDPSGPWRSFINVYATPYQDGIELEIPFTYVSNVVEPVYIDIYFDNADYEHALVYSRYFDRLLHFTSSLRLFTFLLEAGSAQLTFEAHNDHFYVSQSLPIYSRQELHITEFEPQGDTWAHIENITFIDYTGTLMTAKETVAFTGFIDEVVTPTYGRFPIESFALTIVNPSGQTPTFSDVNLLIEDHSRQFPLLSRTTDGDYAVLPMRFVKNHEHYRLDFAVDLYIDPITFIISDRLITGFVPCAGLYFPKDRFRTLQTISFRIEGTVSMLNGFHFRYNSQHYFERSMIGNCQDAAYCIMTDTDSLDVGLWKEIIITDA